MYKPDHGNPQAMSAVIECMAQPDPDIEFLLGPTGPIAAKLDNWQDRPQQRRFAQAVRRAWKQRLHAIAEGECGIGKSHAGLIPAILHALENKKPVVFATKTVALMDQVYSKDLPFLHEALTPWLIERFGRTFTFARIKGLGQYLCEKKFAKTEGLHDIEEWRETTPDGDLGGLPFVPDARTRRQITAERTECSGARCRQAKTCWYYAARKQAFDADVVVTNHALLLAAMRSETPGTVLPIFDACFIDEAHHLQEEATKALGVEFTATAVRKLVNAALEFVGGRVQGLLAEETPTTSCCPDCHGGHEPDCPNHAVNRLAPDPYLPTPTKDLDCVWCTGNIEHEADCPYAPGGELAKDQGPAPHRPASPTLEGIDHELVAFPRALEHATRREAIDGSALLRPEHIQTTAAYEHLTELGEQLRRLALDVESTGTWHGEESQERAQADVLVRSLRSLVGVLKSLASTKPGHVAWLQLGKETSIHSQPLDITEFLKASLWKVPCALSSATLATETGADAFRYIQDTTGCRTLHQVQCPSPFEWPKQAWLYLPEEGLHEGLLTGKTADQRDQNAREYARVAALHVEEVANLTRGRMLYLFTSAKQMGYTVEAIKARGFRWPYLQQGEMSQEALLDWFKSTPGAVLFALSTWWTGVDLPGSALSCVVVDRLPFPPPSDLLHAARLQALGGGVSAFRALSVPLAVTQLKQGFGRLIRTVTDRGVAVLLDPRLQGKHEKLLAALPPARRVSRLELRKHAELFLAGAGERREAQTPHERETLDLLRQLTIPHPEHAACARRFLELGALTEGLWGWAGRMARYYATRNVSETIPETIQNVSERG